MAKQHFSNTWTVNFQIFKLVLEKAEEPEIKLPTSAESSKKHKSSRNTYTHTHKHLFLFYWLCQSLWLCGSPQTVNILKEMGIPDHLTCLLRNLYAGQEATVRTGHGKTDWLQIEKGGCQGCILSPSLFNLYAEYIMRNAGLDEAQAGIKIAGRNLNNLRYADDNTLMAESKKELKSLLRKVEESEKVGLKLNIQKTKTMASGPITSWDIEGETVADFILGGSKITADVDCRHEIKRHLLLGRKDMINLDSILKSRDITSPSSQGYVFSSSHVWMWELDCEESWAPKNGCFWTVVLEKTLENPLDSKEIQPVHPKGDQSWVFIGRTDVEAEAPILWPPDAKGWLIWKDPDAVKDWGQEEKGTTEDEMVGDITDSMELSEFE